MKQLCSTVFCIGCLLSREAVRAEFVNLDFESTSLPVISPTEYGGPVPIVQALPGWAGFWGSTETMEVLHNGLTLGSAAIEVWGPQAPVNRIDGNFSVILVPGRLPFDSSFVDVSITQTGLVPLDSQSLLFKAMSQTIIPPPAADLFDIFIGGQELALTPVETTAEYTLYGGNVAPFAGTEAEVKVTAYWIGSYAHVLLVDSFEFSPNPVPEPGTWALFGIGGLMLGGAIWRRRSGARP